jgi:CxxC motif-containing protein (DUF1111 family)
MNWRTASAKAGREATSSGLPRCGDSVSGFSFLHDGRTTDLTQAIQAHSSNGSEANRVITNYNRLRGSQKQDLLNFLRSL